jgi:hypothetical protein
MIDYVEVARAADMERVALACGLEVTNHKALCPFHDDRRPSLQIYPDGYHCFVCGAHGDAIDLVQHIRNCTKPEAAEYVADLCGGKAWYFDSEAERRETARKREEREYEAAVDELNEADAQIAALNARICDLTPFSAMWVYLYGELNKWLLRRSAADLTVLRMRSDRYDKKHNQTR